MTERRGPARLLRLGRVPERSRQKALELRVYEVESVLEQEPWLHALARQQEGLRHA